MTYTLKEYWETQKFKEFWKEIFVDYNNPTIEETAYFEDEISQKWWLIYFSINSNEYKVEYLLDDTNKELTFQTVLNDEYYYDDELWELLVPHLEKELWFKIKKC